MNMFIIVLTLSTLSFGIAKELQIASTFLDEPSLEERVRRLEFKVGLLEGTVMNLKNALMDQAEKIEKCTHKKDDDDDDDLTEIRDDSVFKDNYKIESPAKDNEKLRMAFEYSKTQSPHMAEYLSDCKLLLPKFVITKKQENNISINMTDEDLKERYKLDDSDRYLDLSVSVVRSDGLLVLQSIDDSNNNNQPSIQLWSRREKSDIYELKKRIYWTYEKATSIMTLTKDIIYVALAQKSDIFALDISKDSQYQVYVLKQDYSNAQVAKMFKLKKTRVLAAHSDGVINIWDSHSRLIIYTDNFKRQINYAIKLNNKTIAVSFVEDLIIYSLNPQEDSRNYNLKQEKQFKKECKITSMSILNERSLMINCDNYIYLWDWLDNFVLKEIKQVFPVTTSLRVDESLIIAVAKGATAWSLSRIRISNK